MVDDDDSKLRSEEQRILISWAKISKRIKEDLANVWTDEVKTEFYKLRKDASRIAFILKKLFKHHYVGWDKYSQELKDLRQFLHDINRIDAKKEWVIRVHADLMQIIRDIEENLKKFCPQELNPFRNLYPNRLTRDEVTLLNSLKENLIHKSRDLTLRQFSSDRNRNVIDPIHVGSLIHGIKSHPSEILDSILDNGILCAEFLGLIEDSETFFHADFVESNKASTLQWQNALNTATDKLPLSVFERLKSYMPFNSKYSQAIALIVNSNQNQSWKDEYVSRANDIKSRFINYIPINYTLEGPNQVSILGGVDSTDIFGIIINPSIHADEIVNVLNSKNVYIPIFDAVGEKVY